MPAVWAPRERVPPPWGHEVGWDPTRTPIPGVPLQGPMGQSPRQLQCEQDPSSHQPQCPRAPRQAQHTLPLPQHRGQHQVVGQRVLLAWARFLVSGAPLQRDSPEHVPPFPAARRTLARQQMAPARRSGRRGRAGPGRQLSIPGTAGGSSCLRRAMGPPGSQPRWGWGPSGPLPSRLLPWDSTMAPPAPPWASGCLSHRSSPAQEHSERRPGGAAGSPPPALGNAPGSPAGMLLPRTAAPSSRNRAGRAEAGWQPSPHQQQLQAMLAPAPQHPALPQAPGEAAAPWGAPRPMAAP